VHVPVEDGDAGEAAGFAGVFGCERTVSVEKEREEEEMTNRR
jgi:hypothetical protein